MKTYTYIYIYSHRMVTQVKFLNIPVVEASVDALAAGSI